MGMCFIPFSQGASCTIQNAPLFIFSTISHQCALCVAIDLIAQMDFKWIAGKSPQSNKRSDRNQKDGPKGEGKKERQDENERLRMEEIHNNVGKESSLPTLAAGSSLERSTAFYTV